MADYTSIKSIETSGIASAVVKSYTCLKKSKAIITVIGSSYNASGNVKINDTVLFQYSNGGGKFMKILDVNVGDIITFNLNGGSVNIPMFGCLIHEDGAF